MSPARSVCWRSGEGKTRWQAAYLQAGDIEQANQLADFKIYPASAATRLQEKLQLLKDRHLNLYRD